MDSLMDALTNVVAALILVLILVQADVTQKVEAFIKDLEPATEEQLQLTRLEIEKLKALLDRKQKLIEEDPPTPKEIEQQKLALSLLEKNLKENQDLLADVEQLRKLEQQLRKERDAEKQLTVTVQDEIAKLLAMLDATPVLNAPPPDEVTIPNSRPIPESAEVYYALVFNGTAHLIDPFSPVKMFMDEFQQNKSKFRIERIKQQGADRYIYDQNKIVEHYKTFDFRNPRKQKVTVLPNKYGTRLQIQILPDPKEGGTTTEQLRQPGSVFEKAMNGIAINRRAVIMFWVNPDSFNTYLLARKFADKAGVPAGWEVRWNTDYRVTIQDVEVRRLEEPPPPKEDEKPKPTPPPLAPKLD